MKHTLIIIIALLVTFPGLLGSEIKDCEPVRVLVVTGGHDYRVEEFNRMLSSLEPAVTCQIAELPGAYEMFLPENRSRYDVLVFYHMWQNITPEQAEVFSGCIAGGKPVVVLHHSICAYDDWPEYWNIAGGKYFHKETAVNGKLYKPCSYTHDVHFRVLIIDKKHPVTKGMRDFQIFDEVYHGYYVKEDVTPLLATDHDGSEPVIGWTHTYGKAKVVTLQSGHDAPTFENPDFRKLLKQAVLWVYQESGKR